MTQEPTPPPAPVTAADREARLLELEACLRDLLPSRLCGESWNLPDDEHVTISVTFGKLARARALLEGSAK